MGIYTISTGLLLLASTASAATGRFCSYPVVNTITSQNAVWTNPELVAGVFVGPSSTTGTIAAGYAYTKSQSVTGTIAGNLAIPGIGSAGVSTSYGVTTARGTSLTVSIACPANIQCGLTASTRVLRVVGTQTMYLCGSDSLFSNSYPCGKSAPNQCPATAWNTTMGTVHPFTLDLPLAASSSNVNELLAVQYNACTVGGAAYKGIAPCPGTFTIKKM